MRGYRKLSLQYKLPIAFGLAIVVTALIVSGVLSWYTYRQMRDDLFVDAEGISKTLARGIAPLMLRDEVWQAYESVVAPLTTASGNKAGQKLVIVLDKNRRIFVSSQPRAFPMQRRLVDLNAEYRPILNRLSPDKILTWYQKTGPLAGHVFVAAPILAEDGLPLGTVIVRFADTLFLDRFNEAGRRAALATLATVLLLLPLGWGFSKRLAEPLVALRRRMAGLPGQAGMAIEASHGQFRSDEIQDLSDQFDHMKAELAKNELLKTRIAAADRLAAIGRLAAGIAHEINNPLGGMINAVNTFERFGESKELAAKTTSLLKRGLAQIKETVGAMLVEARLESRAFTPEDIDDLKTLVGADLATKPVHIVWNVNIDAPIALPATPLRQLILNLLLNAIAASDQNGVVQCSLHFEDGMLAITVRNSGKQVPQDRLLKLFEPYEAESSSGNGLGLWVCYQIVQQLNGVISVNSEGKFTAFVVELPARQEAGRQMEESES